MCSVTKVPQSSAALPEAKSSPLDPKALGEAVASPSTAGTTVDDNQLAREFSVSLIRAAGVSGSRVCIPERDAKVHCFPL